MSGCAGSPPRRFHSVPMTGRVRKSAKAARASGKLGPERVIDYLLRDLDPGVDCLHEAVTVPLTVSKATIASLLSLTPEYFSRVLHELEAARLIELGRYQVRIPDPDRLRRVAHPPTA